MADDFTRAAQALKFNLLGLTAKLRKGAIKDSLIEAGKPIKEAAQRAAPTLAKRTKYRKPGTLKNAIKIRLSKRDTLAGDIGVFVNVKPLPGAQYKHVKSVYKHGKGMRILLRASKRSAKNPNDPFYWYFVDRGTSKMTARPYLIAGRAALPQAAGIFEKSLGEKIKRLNNNPGAPL